MRIESFFVKELSLQVNVVVSSRKEIQESISTITPTIPEMGYKSWVLETFILGITNIFNNIVELSQGDSSIIIKYKEALFSQVVKLNPLLNPKNIYVTPSNSLTLDTGDVKLIDCSTWKVEEDASSLMVLNTNEYSKLVDHARSYDHYIEMEPWTLIDGLMVGVRTFNKNIKTELMMGFTPKTQDDIKYWVVATCVDNFQQLYEFIARDPAISGIPFHKLVYSLYNASIKHNSFLDKLKVKDFQTINTNFRAFQAGRSDSTDTEKFARKSLSAVPKKEILNLEATIKKHIFGQDETVTQVCNAIKRAYSGIKNPKTPIGAFFFYGGTSTGKTELAKVLAKLLTKTQHGLVKIACNTLLSSHNIHTLLGSPPGYVGYEEKGLLERALETNKFKVLLFDEVEKASSKLNDVVLEMLEEGQILLANGTVLDVSNCLIIFTSNIGQAEAKKSTNLAGFSSIITEGTDLLSLQKRQFEKSLKSNLKPEFLARLNGIFYFPPLSMECLKQAASAYLQVCSKFLNKKKLKILYEDQLIDWIMIQCKHKGKELHARDIRNYIDMTVMQQLGDHIINNNLTEEGKSIKISTLSDSLIFE